MNSKDVNCGKFTTKRIDSLQALRAMAFWGIFLTHAQFIFDWAGLGVSIFFVMSSFLLYGNGIRRWRAPDFSSGMKVYVEA